MDIETEHLVGIDEAMAELDRLAADEGQQAKPEPAAEGEAEESVEQGQEHAAQPENDNQDPSKKTTDTRASADAGKKQEEIDKAKAAAEKSAASEKPKSRFAKEQERRTRSWEEINAEKAAVKTEREALIKSQEEFAEQRRKAEEQFSPEQYEKAAEAFEKQGKLEMAEAAREKAKQLRENPQRTERLAAENKKNEDAKKEWATKAAIDFPELAKDKSPLQVRVAQLFKEEPDLKAHPKGIYVAARIANLEAASARVPAMEAELGKLRTRVKELEALTSPGSGGGAPPQAAPKSFEQMSSDDQYAELERLAGEVGSVR